jgi:hypothetical protein
MDEIELEKYRRAADKCWERGLLKLDPKKQQVEQINSKAGGVAWERKLKKEEDAKGGMQSNG